MEKNLLPEFDPQKQGIYQGALRLSFIRAVDEIAYVELIELIGKTFPLFLEFNFSPSIKFSNLRKHQDVFSNQIPIELKEKFRKYFLFFVEWARKYNLDANWFLDALHDRFGHIAATENYYNNQLSFLKYNQLKQLLFDYSEIKNDEYLLIEREELISEIFNILKLKNKSFNTGEKLDSILQFFDDKDEKEIIRVENVWKSERLRNLQNKKAVWVKSAIEMSYGYSFKIENSNFPFTFEFRSWQFNEERKSTFRNEILKNFNKKLDEYFSEIECYAYEQGHKKNEQTKTRFGVTPEDRMKLFVLYQVKKLSPQDCLTELQIISGKKVEMTLQAVSKTIEEISQNLGLTKRKSKTKK